jgi:hypothetical protein
MSKDKVWPCSELTGEQRPFAGGNLNTYDINETLAEYTLLSLLKYLNHGEIEWLARIPSRFNRLLLPHLRQSGNMQQT